MLFFAVTLICALVFFVLEEDEERAVRHGRRISIVPTECFNLKILCHHDDSSIDVTPITPMHQWFAATFTNLPTERETTIRICMAGNDCGANRADCRKWVGLRPLLTYADPEQAACYAYYQRDKRGRWISGDIVHPAIAGCGHVPDQQVIPVHLAEEFLSHDGTRWFPWQEIDDTHADIQARTFTIRHRFRSDRATIAMHVPYTIRYQESYLEQIEAAHLPGVHVDGIGQTADGRALSIIRVDDPAMPTPLHISDGVPRVCIEDAPNAEKPRVILVIAREHGSEHSGSWVLQGILRQLLADTPAARRLRVGTTWLLLPLFDPDGAANSAFHVITSRFFPHKDHPVYGSETPPEVIAYAYYLRAFINSGRMMAAVTSFYGLECNEGKPVLSPFIIQQERDVVQEFNTFWFDRLQQLGIPTGSPCKPWAEGHMPYRLNGWCWYWYGAFASTFEVNDRYPDCRLDVPDLERIGANFAISLVDFLATPAGRHRLADTRQFLARRTVERDLWFRTSMAGTPDEPTLYDLLSMGY